MLPKLFLYGKFDFPQGMSIGYPASNSNIGHRTSDSKSKKASFIAKEGSFPFYVR